MLAKYNLQQVIFSSRNRTPKELSQASLLRCYFRTCILIRICSFPGSINFKEKKTNWYKREKEMVGVSTNPNFVKYPLDILILCSGFTLTKKPNPDHKKRFKRLIGKFGSWLIVLEYRGKHV